MRTPPLLYLFALAASVAACKPPPTDADMLRAMPEAEPAFASEPLPSPDTEGAVWAMSERVQNRLIYGVPGEPALLLLDCDLTAQPTIQITRTAPADEGAGALLALVGNGHIGRVAVDASEVGGQFFWTGNAPAQSEVWEPLAGPRQVTLTVPGAGMVTLNPSEAPWEMLTTCRGVPAEIEAPEPVQPEVPEIELSIP